MQDSIVFDVIQEDDINHLNRNLLAPLLPNRKQGRTVCDKQMIIRIIDIHVPKEH